ncbi:tetratricopeptide repeat protein [Cytobacillus firmus]|uniref:helix-turn-helix domain-containing protein n=1 Tax=Cytobacillus firmus TaxID=1399 RepID=UPI0018CC87AE|nr:tetratricopeptide repeat protein [Cytobacillus firmus]MBG9547968.1 XRE family transcriptional regulator [Cytobacillus firmus]MBG9601437.1 XRE family transcriptional regulator [Cytobacillus firmus]MDD9310189.1 tetratricopeptide repeat protein [Cytobacillus firmus]MED1942937.1 tetratricopeptide repeat protein [Cytobacillus firmus]
MNFSAIGQRIRELRKLMNLSQGELAKGICTQAQISKIEKGDVYPYASTLYLISERLGVDVNYFFDIGTTPRLDYVQEVLRQLTLARRNSDYREMEQIVKTEEKNPLFQQNNKNYQVLLWHKGICQYMLHKDSKAAIDILSKAIALTHYTDKVWSEREIEVLLSIGSVYFEEKEYKKSLKTYFEAKEYLHQLPFINDHTLLCRLYYNIARSLTRLEKYNDSIKYCREAVRWCIEKDNLYLLGELHYHIGYNYEIQGKFQKARECMQKSLIIFELQEDEKYVNFINSKIQKWHTFA